MEIFDATDTDRYGVETAILVHANARAPSSSRTGCRFATIHSVSRVDGRPEIRAGTVLGQVALRRLLRRLTPRSGLTFLDARILASSPDALVWWRPPAPARMWFNTVDGKYPLLGQRTGMAPQPGLVFAATRQGFFVWAVKGEARPDAGTALCQAPYFNVSNDGRICVGNAPVPRGFDPSIMERFEASWWGSRFTHPNVHIKRELTLWRGGAERLWSAMLSGRYSAFPDRALVSRKHTLADAIAAMDAPTKEHR